MLSYLKKLFEKWIISVEEDTDWENLAKLNKFKGVSNDDIVLSFCYTRTIQKIYKIENVIHLHSKVSNFDNIIVGHAISNREFLNEDVLKDSSFDILQSVSKEYYKDTYEVIKRKLCSLKDLDNVKKIFVFGHSISKEDRNYYLY